MTRRCADIAVIGMACRFPGATNYMQFWENLKQGVNSISEIPVERWATKEYYSLDMNVPNKSVSKWCGLIEGVDQFDNRFFNISPREARNMDPQQRLLLEETWHCIEDSGISLNSLQQKRTSVYVGVMTGDYRQIWASSDNETDSYSCLGNVESILANRISYIFNFKGPSFSINAACASSLVAVHQAKCSLRLGESDYAIAGGVNLNLHPWKYISFSKSNMLSPDGQCKTFDGDANGYVPGDGVGLLLLQRMEDAIAEGNHIYGIIKGSAVNHCGRSLSITAPRVDAQRDVILESYDEAGVSPETVTYVEAHGTGTSLGDPIEIEALTRAFRKHTEKNQYCKIGSVKTNIGHLESSAGVAGIIKVLLMMRHKKVPPTLNIKVPNPIIDFEITPFEISTGLKDWTTGKDGNPLRAGVSSFGFGGVNSHVLLEEYPENKSKNEHASEPYNLFVLSAKNPEVLQEMIRKWELYTRSKEFQEYNIRDICLTLLLGREQFPYRYGAIVRNKEEIINQLLENADTTGFGEGKKKRCLRIGQLISPGSQEVSRLISVLPPLKRSFELIYEKMSDRYNVNNLSDFLITVAPEELSFWFSYALIQTYISLGFDPDLITGEGAGLWVSLAISGIINPEDIPPVLKGDLPLTKLKLNRPAIPLFDAVHGTTLLPYLFDGEYLKHLINGIHFISNEVLMVYVAKARSLFQRQLTFTKYIKEWNKPLNNFGLNMESLLFNEPMIEGQWNEKKAILIVAILGALNRLNSRWDLINTRTESNEWLNEMIDLINDDVMPKDMAAKLILDKTVNMEKAASLLNARQHRMDTQKPYLNIKNHNMRLNEIQDFDIWFNNALSSKFEIEGKDQFLFLDIGKSTYLDYNGIHVEIEDAADFERAFTESLLNLWLRGLNCRWDVLCQGIDYRKASLPLYPFNRDSHWVSHTINSTTQHQHPMIYHVGFDSNGHTYCACLSGNEYYLTDHIIGNKKTLPGSVCLEMALCSGFMAKDMQAGIMKNIAWPQPVSFSSRTQEEKDVFIGLYPSGDTFKYRIWTLDEACKKITHAQGVLVYQTFRDDRFSKHINIESFKNRCYDVVQKTECYSLLGNMGFYYGPAFQTVREFFSSDTEGLSRLELTAQMTQSFKEFLLHPLLVDGAFQTAILQIARSGKEGQYLPFSLGEVQMAGPLPMNCYAHVKERKPGPSGTACFDINITDSSGRTMVTMTEFTLRESSGITTTRDQSDNHLLHVFHRLAGGDLNVEEVARILGGLENES